MKIAVIGAGSSGLLTIKYLLESYPASDITCFEKSDSIRGCWGDQRADFISTSTKYTTQFSCFRKWQPEVTTEQAFEEFYQGSEFGDYLDAFAAEFNLKQCIHFGYSLKRLEHIEDQWRLLLRLENGKEVNQTFDAVFLCTGLVNKKRPLDSAQVPIAEQPESIRNRKVVVVGGGESASDVANHLAKSEYHNEVYLSLRSGIRVSPRYHPIRGVPSDFLRNRLMLSINKDLRNWVGEYFVSFRIHYNNLHAKLFSHQQDHHVSDDQEQALRKNWDLKLKAHAKGRLFNVFHNKSDSFLDAIGKGQLKVIGPPTNNQWNEFFDFDQKKIFTISPEVLVPSTGYHSQLSDLSCGSIGLKDFHHGCVHIGSKRLFLIGFARPIIGNIPSISEMQVRYTLGVLSGKYYLPANIQAKQDKTWQERCNAYSTIDTDNVYPVEQFPYCDLLAKEMGVMPSLANVRSLKTWLKIMLVPASTTHYTDKSFDRKSLKQERVYMPSIIIVLILIASILELPWRYLNKIKLNRMRAEP